MKTISAILLLTLGVLAAPAGAVPVVVPGGGDATTDCYAGFEVDGVNLDGVSFDGTVVSQKACSVGGKFECTFTVSACINEPVEGCAASPVGKFKETVAAGKPKAFKRGNLPPTGGSDHVCGATPATVKIRLKGQGTAAKRRTIKTVAKADGGKDKDTLVLDCQPNQENTGCVACPPTARDAACADNPQGGPSELSMTVAPDGDLDTGWTGVSHNFPIVVGSPLKWCLTGCDTTTDSICDANGTVGGGSLNGRVWGAPLPLLSGGVPVCVVNEFADPLTGTLNLQDGTFDGRLHLTSIVFTFTSATSGAICPQCNGGNAIGDRGTCGGGPNRGQPCTIEGLITLNNDNPQITNAKYRLSGSCPPGGLGYDEVGRLDIDIPLTTQLATRTGTCNASQANGCGGGSCGNSCPSTPPLKGGINQTCCSNRPDTPCFPNNIQRAGTPSVPGTVNDPQAIWPDTAYPKCFASMGLAGTFAIPATASSVVNGVAGLPGCGALIMPMDGKVIQ